MRNISRIALVLGIILISSFLIFISSSNEVRLFSVNGRQFKAEIADTNEKMKLGLGERDALCKECAMVFVFPKKKIYPFWMKGMRFPLDIIWFDSADGKIVHMEKNIPFDFKGNLTPPVAADRVLEINGGLCDEYRIKIGDTINAEK